MFDTVCYIEPSKGQLQVAHLTERNNIPLGFLFSMHVQHNGLFVQLIIVYF